MDRLESLSIFATVAELGSFAEAARQLNRSPASVTRAVSALEDYLQSRLLNRTTRSVALTDAGARYLENCRRVLAAYDELEAMNFGDQVQPRGIVNVTAPSMFGRLHVLGLVRSFLDRHPQVDVRLLLLDRVVSLVDEGLDLGIRLGELPDSSLRAVRVGQVQRQVYGSADYFEHHAAPRTPQDLVIHAIVACTTVTPVPNRWTFHAAGGPVTVSVKPRLIVNTTDAALAAVVDGAGLTCIMSYQAKTHVDSGKLKPVLIGYQPPPEPIHIVHPVGRHLPAKIRLLIDHIADGLRKKFGE
ncbi:MAG: LysR family transcriptional regulator [Alphaproteobacteria bacterium]